MHYVIINLIFYIISQCTLIFFWKTGTFEVFFIPRSISEYQKYTVQNIKKHKTIDRYITRYKGKKLWWKILAQKIHIESMYADFLSFHTDLRLKAFKKFWRMIFARQRRDSSNTEELCRNNLSIYACLIRPVCRCNTLKYDSIPAALRLTQNKLFCT